MDEGMASPIVMVCPEEQVFSVERIARIFVVIVSMTKRIKEVRFGPC